MTGPAPHREYTDRLTAGSLPYQSCDGCLSAVFPPRVICPFCGATDLGWRESAGLGTVYSTSVIAPRDADPYPVVLVDLDERFRIMSTVVDVPAGDVRIGMRVRAGIDPGGPTGPRVVFTPEERETAS
ncbi:Zn-ribbon domain-containing OB-fold protein [Microtetraspora malaysiensis]|uniref:Zn-ribbon domain-containing OB-fold protein n=1 Tax=Microtetraspora malaysiensis TaxID=161358 RepID=UPI000829A5F3|nr:OB-fold domain-containing protein [Microtetraspora malaysiensis]